MAYLVDSSVWIDFLRNADTAAAVRLADVMAADPDLIIGSPPVRMELCLPRGEVTRRRTLALYDQLVDTGIASEDFDNAAEIYRSVRLSGHTVRSLIDCLLAAIAERTEHVLVHADVDFARIAAVRPSLTIESWL